MKKRYFIFLISIFLLCSFVSAEIQDSEYYFVIEDNGNTIVAASFYGQGEITIPIPEDVETIEIKGGLYIIENNELTIAIGKTEKAIIAYRTSLLTEKSGEKWNFSVKMEETTNKTITIALPGETIIKEVIPESFIEKEELTIINLENPGNLEEISIEYYFPLTGEDKKTRKIQIIATIISLIVLIGLIILSTRIKGKNKKITSTQEKLLQTLTDNEEKVVRLLLEKRKPLKRNFIRKTLKIAKSSLAATINNLERKKIIEVNKEYTQHIIKLKKEFEND